MRQLKSQLLPLLPDFLMVAGAASVSGGAWMIYSPAGYIIAGVLAIYTGVRIAK